MFAAQQQVARDTIEGLCTYFAEDAKQTGDIKDWKALLAHNKKAMDLLEDASTKKLKIEHGSDHQCTQWDSFLQKSIEKYGEQLYFAFCLTHYTNALHAHLVKMMKANPMGEGYDFEEYQKMKVYTEEVCLFQNNQQFKQFSFDVIQAMNGQNLSEKMLNCFLNNIDPARCAITKRYTFTNTPLAKKTIQDAIESIAKKYKNLDNLQSLYKEFLKFSQAQPSKPFFERYTAAQENKQLKTSEAMQSLDRAQNFAQGWRALAQALAQENDKSVLLGLDITKEHIFFQKEKNPPRNLPCSQDPFTFLAQLIKEGYGAVIKQCVQDARAPFVPFQMFVFSDNPDKKSIQTLSDFLQKQGISHKIGYTNCLLKGVEPNCYCVCSWKSKETQGVAKKVRSRRQAQTIKEDLGVV
ncbi:MAG: hypothetical protein ACPG7U_01440 [Holosporaceae bacterium]